MRASETMEGTLDQARCGTLLEILGVYAEGEIRRRLLDMGLVKGARIHVIRKAPLGDPVEVEINGFFLTLRLEEAKTVRVRLLGTGPFHHHGGPHHGRGRGMGRGRHRWFHRFNPFSDTDHS
ncbi:ferrous iron transport protein A [Fidelibacter multiformis]|jgi:ferrous iron transport protein A|uniref:FeoA family protein n=1 Tax=Fidelibacter multiformis TaxID=3377529 RepID=UPI0037DCD8BE